MIPALMCKMWKDIIKIIALATFLFEIISFTVFIREHQKLASMIQKSGGNEHKRIRDYGLRGCNVMQFPK
jgi:hypothetical protein